jgi:prepilin-type N-terminal cleavage/methylation domain-containing protein
MLKRKKASNRGFTLIELLVVIAIIGILASVVLTSLNTGRKKARDARRQSDIRQIALAMEMYYDDGEKYLPISNNTMPTAIGTYLPSVPVDPLNSGSNVYKTVTNTGDLQKYCIWATLEIKDSSNNTVYEVASETGVGETTTAPTGLGTSCR